MYQLEIKYSSSFIQRYQIYAKAFKAQMSIFVHLILITYKT